MRLLDVVRAMAVGMVVLSHLPASQAIVNGMGWGQAYNTQVLGMLGVGIFFVHTSLVLMMSLHRMAQGGGEPLVAGFYVRRLFRIYPLVIVVVLACTVFELDPIVPSLTAGDIAANFLLVQNITGSHSVPPVLWSLPFEVQMYVLLPFIHMWVFKSSRGASGRAVILLVASCALVLGLALAGCGYQLLKYLPAFLPGVLSMALMKSPIKCHPACLLTMLAVLVVAYPVGVAHGIQENLLIWPVCLMVGIGLALSRDMQAGSVTRLAHTVSKYSFGIYLVHPILIEWCFHQGHMPVYLAWPLFLAGTWLVSVLLYHAVEKPCIAWGASLARHLGTRQQPQGARPLSS